jgi:inorganic pyrophosphatase
MSRNGTKNGMADPSRLKPLDGDHEKSIKVVIEIPAGSRNKYAFDPDDRTFTSKKVLPAGMTFPYEFGFVLQRKPTMATPLTSWFLWMSPGIPAAS